MLVFGGTGLALTTCEVLQDFNSVLELQGVVARIFGCDYSDDQNFFVSLLGRLPCPLVLSFGLARSVFEFRREHLLINLNLNFPRFILNLRLSAIFSWTLFPLVQSVFLQLCMLNLNYKHTRGGSWRRVWPPISVGGGGLPAFSQRG